MANSISNLLDLKPLHLPPPPSWWPLAWGWLSLIACIVILIFIVIWSVRKYRRWMAPKKTALRLLKQPAQGRITPSDAMELVRQASLFYYPRQNIAHLTGRAWYEFLDQQLGQSLFIPNEALWQQALYQSSVLNDTQHLIDDCCTWVQGALPPKRKHRR